MQNYTNRQTSTNKYEDLASFLQRLNNQNTITKSDKMFLASIVKRQRQLIQDLVYFDQRYKGALDNDIVGGLYSIYTLLENQAQSLTLKN